MGYYAAHSAITNTNASITVCFSPATSVRFKASPFARKHKRGLEVPFAIRRLWKETDVSGYCVA